MKGIQNQKPRGGSWSGDHGRVLLVYTFSACSAAFLYIPRPPAKGAITTVVCTLPHQSLVRKMFHRLAYRSPGWGWFLRHCIWSGASKSVLHWSSSGGSFSVQVWEPLGNQFLRLTYFMCVIVCLHVCMHVSVFIHTYINGCVPYACLMSMDARKRALDPQNWS